LTNKNDIELLKKEIERQSNRPIHKTFFLLLRMSDSIQKFVDFELKKEFKARTTGTGILMNLILNGGSSTSTELSNLIPRSKFTITRVIDTLVDYGFVKRVSKRNDRRSKNILITRNGIETVKNGLPIRTKIANNALSFLSQEHIAILLDIIMEINNHLENVVYKKED